MDTVAIYCRLSDEDKDKNRKLDESESIKNQKILLTRYAIEKGWSIYKIYSDDDYSGLDINRPSFNRMIQDAKEGKFNIVLCKHQSRFSRDIEIVERYLHRKFPEWGIRFVSLTDHVDTLDDTNKKSRQINSLVNEWYCEDISKSVRATFKVKREEGKFIGSFAPYGYKKDPKDKNRLIIDEDAARVIKKIFNWYLEGYGTQHIAYKLNKMDIPNPTKYKQNKGLKYKNSSQTDSYGLWNKTTIRRILRNEVYIGNMVQGKREKVNYKSKKVNSKKRKDWIVVKNTHEPIIKPETFKLVQRRLNEKIRSTVKGKPHIFAGKVRCMDCKSTMYKVKTDKYEYLRCKLYARDPRKRLCTSHSIRLDRLEDVVIKKIKEQFKKVNDDNLVHSLYNQIQFNKEVQLIQKEINNIDKQIKEKDYLIQNLYIDKVNGIISDELFLSLNNKFKYEKENLLKNKETKLKEIKNIKEYFEDLEKWREIVLKYKKVNKLTYNMVNQLINYIEVGEKDKDKREQKVKIYWRF
ncbi:recombinase family protein [Thermohalobacter berrensis]|uniref:Recombinase n=1 Tax=Thermohalobacter berrensis TaxID=99594 RepID=A0A419T4S4_9FIRM|nr:recombinase family protein [Thermohalobacter berrensis]RKD32455.1 recombinase [Thermohalobacter berrensis]